MKKSDKTHYLNILCEVYKNTTPPVDLEDFIKSGKSQEDGFFMHYYISEEDYNKIVEDYFKEKKVPLKIRDGLKMSLLLGASPTFKGFYYKLTRLNDGFVATDSRVRFIEFDENNKGKDWFHNIAVGRSLLLGSLSPFFTWQTTQVIEVIEDNGGFGCHFKTKNSEYKLERILKDE